MRDTRAQSQSARSRSRSPPKPRKGIDDDGTPSSIVLDAMQRRRRRFTPRGTADWSRRDAPMWWWWWWVVETRDLAVVFSREEEEEEVSSDETVGVSREEQENGTRFGTRNPRTANTRTKRCTNGDRPFNYRQLKRYKLWTIIRSIKQLSIDREYGLAVVGERTRRKDREY